MINIQSQRAMACVGIPRKEQLRIFKLFDEDGDQKIDLQEWRSFLFLTPLSCTPPVVMHHKPSCLI